MFKKLAISAAVAGLVLGSAAFALADTITGNTGAVTTGAKTKTVTVTKNTAVNRARVSNTVVSVSNTGLNSVKGKTSTTGGDSAINANLAVPVTTGDATTGQSSTGGAAGGAASAGAQSASTTQGSTTTGAANTSSLTTGSATSNPQVINVVNTNIQHN
jgi:hypothetical protein